MGEHDATHEWRLTVVEADVKTLWGKMEAVKTLLITNLVGIVFLLAGALVSLLRGNP